MLPGSRSPHGGRVPVDTDTAAFQNEFQGPATEDTLRAIRARIAEVEGWPESEIRSAQLAALSAVEDEALKSWTPACGC